MHDSTIDSIAWNNSPDGSFTTKHAYQLAKGITENRNSDWKWLWSIPTHPKIQHLFWLILHNRVMTRSHLKSIGVIHHDTCPVCNLFPESQEHLFRDCNAARSIWDQLKAPNISGTDDIFSWIKSNSKSEQASQFHNIPWKIIFPMAIWRIWINRNSAIFPHNNVKPDPIDAIIYAAAEVFVSTPSLGSTSIKQTVLLRWLPPPVNFFKLNTDGSAIGNPGTAGAGGIIHDHNGTMISAFSRKLGRTTNLAAELWAIRDGLQLADSLNLHGNIIVESDSQVAINLINSCFIDTHTHSAIISDCRWLVKKLEVQALKFIPREMNNCADYLAKASISQRRLSFV